jgi:hypothetical protein
MPLKSDLTFSRRDRFRLVLKQTYATNKAHWILIMLLAPIVGITMYVIFARDFTTRRLL